MMISFKTHLISGLLRGDKVVIGPGLSLYGVHSLGLVRLVASVQPVIDHGAPYCSRLIPVVRRKGEEASVGFCS